MRRESRIWMIRYHLLRKEYVNIYIFRLTQSNLYILMFEIFLQPKGYFFKPSCGILLHYSYEIIVTLMLMR